MSWERHPRAAKTQADASLRGESPSLPVVDTAPKPRARKRTAKPARSRTATPSPAPDERTAKRAHPSAPALLSALLPAPVMQLDGDSHSWDFEYIHTNVYVNRRPKPPPTENGCFCPFIEGEPGCVAGCMNRAQNIECVAGLCACGVSCTNQRFQRRSYAAVMPFRTTDRGWGLVALEDIARGRFVIEYVGEVIDSAELARRVEARSSSSGDGSDAQQTRQHFYYLSLDGPHETLDAARRGNLARFINHSCAPNCVTERWQVLGEWRVGVFARTHIAAGTELTFDYNLHSFGPAKVPCRCGAPKCRGFI